MCSSSILSKDFSREEISGSVVLMKFCLSSIFCCVFAKLVSRLVSSNFALLNSVVELEYLLLTSSIFASRVERLETSAAYFDSISLSLDLNVSISLSEFCENLSPVFLTAPPVIEPDFSNRSPESVTILYLPINLFATERSSTTSVSPTA